MKRIYFRTMPRHQSNCTLLLRWLELASDFANHDGHDGKQRRAIWLIPSCSRYEVIDVLVFSKGCPSLVYAGRIRVPRDWT